MIELLALQHTNYKHELTRHWVADLVARYFSKSMAKVVIEKLQIADTPQAAHIISLIKDINGTTKRDGWRANTTAQASLKNA